MATIKKRGNGYSVRWREGHRQYRHQCPDAATARRIKLEIETAHACGQRWQPRRFGEGAGLRVIAEAWITHLRRVRSVATATTYAVTLGRLLRWLEEEWGEHVPPDVLSRALLEEWYATDLNDVSAGTRNQYMRTVQGFWAWAWDHDDWGEVIPRPRKVALPDDPPKPTTVAPTWEEMDAAIHAAPSDDHARLCTLMRFTGLRIGACVRLEWGDLDLERQELHFRGELGKSRAEKAHGRVLPLSPHLITRLAGWGRRDGLLLSSHSRRFWMDGLTEAWEASGVRKQVWAPPGRLKRQQAHAFRKGFVSGLKALQVDDEAVAYLVGHDLATRGRYLDPRLALGLAQAVAAVPDVSVARPTNVQPIDIKEGAC